MKTQLAIFLMLTVSTFAEPVFYLTMTQTTTNAEPVLVADVECATPEACTNLMNQLAADPDYFGAQGGEEELAWVATIHQHDHYNPTPCVEWECGSHASKKTGLDSFVTLSQTGIVTVVDVENIALKTGTPFVSTEIYAWRNVTNSYDITTPGRFIPTVIRLGAKNNADADKQADKIAKKFKKLDGTEKQWKVEKHLKP